MISGLARPFYTVYSRLRFRIQLHPCMHSIKTSLSMPYFLPTNVDCSLEPAEHLSDLNFSYKGRGRTARRLFRWHNLNECPFKLPQTVHGALKNKSDSMVYTNLCTSLCHRPWEKGRKGGLLLVAYACALFFAHFVRKIHCACLWDDTKNKQCEITRYYRACKENTVVNGFKQS